MRTDLYQFAVVGGDLRQWYLADILASKGHGVLAYGLCKDEKIENVKYVSSVKELIQEAEVLVILSILVYTFFSRMFDLMLPPVAKHSIVVA